jgi:hypothetical protein
MGIIRKFSSLWILLLSLLVFGVGGFFAIRAHDAMTCKNWPVTSGMVWAIRQTPIYFYSARGAVNDSDIVSCNELVNGYEALWNSQSYVARYPLGASVTVHYHPHKKNVAVLDTQFNGKYLIPVVALFLVGLMLFVKFCKVWSSKLKKG